MTTIRYYIVERNTNKIMSVHCWEHKAIARVAAMPDAENYMVVTDSRLFKI